MQLKSYGVGQNELQVKTKFENYLFRFIPK